MVAIPDSTDPTLAAIDEILERKNASEPKRNYLGASSIADPCNRKLWMRLHSQRKEVFDADTLRRFNDGHRSEDVMAAHLRLVPGIELHTYIEGIKPPALINEFDDQHGKWNQYGFEDKSLGPKVFSGHYDGVILGILQAPKTWHIWEHKAVNEKKFAKALELRRADEKKALEQWDKVYYGQAVINMFKEGLTRHYMTISTPGCRAWTSFRTEENPVYAEALIRKAGRIINMKTPPDCTCPVQWGPCFPGDHLHD
jgi:hypothetical protein